MGSSKFTNVRVGEAGRVQKWSDLKIGAIAIGAILAVLLLLLCISLVRKSAVASRAAEIAKQEREYRKWREEQTEEYLKKRNQPYQTPVPSAVTSVDLGSAMGHMVAMMGKPYPADVEIEQMAKTKAVDAGHQPNNPIFISSFKTAFAAGYSEGRQKYNAR